MERVRVNKLRRFMRGVWRVSWPVARQVLGWFFIVLGLLGIVLPVLQGVLFLVVGIALVGRRNIVIRRSRVALKRALRRWAALPTPVVGPSGRMALRAQREFSRSARHLHQRFDAWREQRFGRPPAQAHGAAERYDHPPDRVYTE
jgi:hypothetical protein